MLPTFTTKRLRLRTPSWDDEAGFYQMGNDPEVMRYITPGRVQTKDEARNDLRKRINAAQNGQMGIWVVEESISNTFLGWACLKPLDNTADIEIGYRFLRTTWGKGVATEASQRLLEYGFTELQLPHIVGVTMPENRASRKVLEKIGLHYRKEAVYYSTKVVFYQLDRSDWEKDRAPSQP